MMIITYDTLLLNCNKILYNPVHVINMVNNFSGEYLFNY